MYIQIDAEWFEKNKEAMRQACLSATGQDGYLIDLEGRTEIEWTDEAELSITEDLEGIYCCLNATVGFEFTLDSMRYYLEQTEKQTKAIKELMK